MFSLFTQTARNGASPPAELEAHQCVAESEHNRKKHSWDWISTPRVLMKEGSKGLQDFQFYRTIPSIRSNSKAACFHSANVVLFSIAFSTTFRLRYLPENSLMTGHSKKTRIFFVSASQKATTARPLTTTIATDYQSLRLHHYFGNPI